MSNNLRGKLFTFIILFVFLYEINLAFVPILTSKQIMEILGIVLFLTRGKGNVSKVNYKKIFLLAGLLIPIALFSIIMNGGGQWMYQKVIISTVLNFFGAYFVVQVAKKSIKNFDVLMQYLLGCVALQCVAAVIMKAVPPIYVFLYSFITSEAVTNNVEYSIEGMYRLVGLGNAIAFSALPTVGLGMLSCAYLINKSTGRRFYGYCLLFFLITCISFLLVRTSILLSGLSVLYILYNYYKAGNIKMVFRLFIVVFIALLSIVTFAIVILPEDMYKWAFEVFLNIQDGGSATDTGSANLLYEMFTETKFTLMTYVIGDAMYTNPSGGYYRSVDIGMYRHVLYYGVIGLSVYLALHYRILNLASRFFVDTEKKRYFKFLFFMFLVIMMKGDAILVPYFILLLVFVDYGGLSDAISKSIHK